MAAGILFLVVRMVMMMMMILSSRVVVGCTSNCLHYSAKSGNRIYKFRLGAPIKNYPHGILSEDGFYSVARNGTKLWFQACDQMIFNHDPPKCFRCEGCGGVPQCGTQCGGLISVNIDGYHVCSAVGQAASTEISLIDKKKPRLGVLLKMSANGSPTNCSLSIAVFCDSHLMGPTSFNKSGRCIYSTTMKHPAACAEGPGPREALGWFGSLMIILIFSFGGYILVGTAYRYFHLGVQGVEVIPNLDFWRTVPHQAESLYTAASQRVSAVFQTARGFQTAQGSYRQID